VLNFIRKLAEASPQSAPKSGNSTQQEAAQHALARLRRVTRPGSLLFLLSDFRSLDESAEAHLIHLARHNDVVLIFIHDRLEKQLPPSGNYRLTDGQRTICIDTGSRALKKQHAERFHTHEAWLTDLCRRAGMHLLSCTTDQDPHAMLQAGLGRRCR